MKELPLISVIVPVYKVEAYLDQCIASIAGQTYRNLEIILVDDGSPDRSGAICDAWAERDSRVRVIHKENGGGGAARNDGLDQASGELIAFVDSDDYIASDMLQHLYGLLESDIDIAECGFVETYDDNATFSQEETKRIVCTTEEAMQAHIQDTIFRQLIWNKLYRRKVIEKVRFPIGTKIDDEFFTYQVLGNAKKLICSNKVCYAYRQQPDSVMHQIFSIKRLEGLLAKQERLLYLKKQIPSLVYEAEVELFFSCIYAMQGSLHSLQGQELEEACSLVETVRKNISEFEIKTLSVKKKILIILARWNLKATARLLNFLIRIHVLT